MILRPDLAALSPQQRAELIYAEARSDLSTRLWRAALGDADSGQGTADPFAQPNASRFDSLLQMLATQATKTPTRAPENLLPQGYEPAPARVEAPSPTRAAARPVPVPAADCGPTCSAKGLGPNARYRELLESAAAQSGIPATALAAIVDAEAAKNRDGSWNPHSRNPRSSAAGLGQFLSRTWEGLAETGGSWLNGVAKANGWLDERGQLRSAARGALLALRYDPEASIRGIADFARHNLDRLERRGIPVGDDTNTVARAAYLSHHLGLGDAMRFLKGGIASDRARMLLKAQVGAVAAERRIGAAGDATVAHREWLLAYIDRKIQPARFAA